MTDEIYKKDIRALLKTFGVMADEAIVGHIAKNPSISQLNLKVILVDDTKYDNQNCEKLSLEINRSIECK